MSSFFGKEYFDERFTLKNAEFLSMEQLKLDMKGDISEILGGELIQDTKDQKAIINEVFSRIESKKAKIEKNEKEYEKTTIDERLLLEEENLYGVKAILALQKEMIIVQTIKKTLHSSKREYLRTYISALEEEIYIIENNIDYIKREQYTTLGDKDLFVKSIAKNIKEIENCMNDITKMFGLAL